MGNILKKNLSLIFKSIMGIMINNKIFFINLNKPKNVSLTDKDINEFIINNSIRDENIKKFLSKYVFCFDSRWIIKNRIPNIITRSIEPIFGNIARENKNKNVINFIFLLIR